MGKEAGVLGSSPDPPLSPRRWGFGVPACLLFREGYTEVSGEGGEAMFVQSPGY